jgi:hypothetical protein
MDSHPASQPAADSSQMLSVLQIVCFHFQMELCYSSDSCQTHTAEDRVRTQAYTRDISGEMSLEEIIIRAMCLSAVSLIATVQVTLEHGVKARGEQRYLCTLSLTSPLNGGGWSSPRPCGFTPGKTRYPLCRRLGGP